jgi:mRNA export factor
MSVTFSSLPAPVQKDVEVSHPPDDAISCLKFSPPSVQQTYLIASSWANDVRCWEIQPTGQTVPKAMQKHDAPILSCCWSDDGSKVFTASCDKTAKMWDLQSNAFIQIAAHDQAIRTIHYIQQPSYSCVMTGSWDRTGEIFARETIDALLLPSSEILGYASTDSDETIELC